MASHGMELHELVPGAVLKNVITHGVIKILNQDGRYFVYKVLEQGLATSDVPYGVIDTSDWQDRADFGRAWEVLSNFKKGEYIQVRDCPSDDWVCAVFDNYVYGAPYPFSTNVSAFTLAKPYEETITIDNKEFSLEKVREAVANLTPVS